MRRLLFVVAILISSLHATNIEVKQKKQDALEKKAVKNPSKKTEKKLEKLENNTWTTPDNRLRYDQVCFLMAHNAFASQEKGYTYAQQKWSIVQQLNHGVRGLMLDIYDHKNNVVLCHQACSDNYKFLLTGKADFKWQTLQKALENIYSWLKQNKTEIVTIILEDYTRDPLDSVINDIPGLSTLIFDKEYWDFAAHDGYWPTIKQLQEDNKRLIIFSSKTFTGSSYVFYKWQYMFENKYSTTEISKARRERSDSKWNNDNLTHLMLLNFFPKISTQDNVSVRLSKTKNVNQYDSLKKLIKTVQESHDLKNKTPNFIALDFVNTGNPLKLVNELNKSAAAHLSVEKKV